ncbi:hypothetical protein M3201_17690 [Paenibacillus motobuensis]|uniref:hypothetical protein n=1 Tax=Paenibacillus TaxID=44249 RepID=UPI002040066D|nr:MULTISPECIES: hypothetical protein [Paenibacillus]MCM3041529.1 hypothetical protein [Paenibacillus lutimineralis]MCM3648633.1 hypothetical protein [Paenibacillus motobuensis]
MKNVIIEEIISGLGKSAADLVKDKIMQSKGVRDLKEKWVTDNYHDRTVKIFKAAVIDAKEDVKLPDELFCDLLEDSVNRDEVFRWIREGVRPGQMDKSRLNTTAYMESFPRYQDHIYPFFELVLNRLEHYKRTNWSPEFLEMLHQIEELKTASHEGIKSLSDKQDRMESKQDKIAAKQDQMYELLHDKLEDRKKRYTPEWFTDRARENIKNMGERYSEELNVEVKASLMIDAIELNDKFRGHMIEKCDSILAGGFFRSIDQVITTSLEKIKEIKRDMESLNDLKVCLPQLEQCVKDLKSYLDKNPHNIGSGPLRHEVNDFYSKYVDNDISLLRIALNPYVVISGEAGAGKSHFMADQVLKRINANKMSIFLLGQLFHSEDTILSQIRKQLAIASDEEMEAVFEVFNDYGAAKGERVVIFIDALNEGKGKHYWLNSLGGFVERLRKLSNMALVMSVRNTYENDIIPEGFYRRDNVNKYKFEGFDDLDQAIQEFFNYYQVPLVLNDYLKYEFQNPLFLKMYCMAYDQVNRSGTESIEGIFNNYFKKINENLKLRIENYPKFGNLVVEALYYFIDAKLKHKGSESNLLYEVASREVNQAMVHHGLGIHFFDELINEKIITVNPITPNGEEKNIVYIAYELFEEYITAKKIIEANQVHTYTKARDLEDFFSDQNRYFHLLSDRRSNQGIFEALAVQIPDAVSPEFIEEFEMYHWPKRILRYKEIYFKAAYYNSLTWRRPRGINGISHSYILNEFLYRSYTEPYQMYEFWDVVLKYTIVKGHYYNANFLYNQLIGLKLDEFNAFWTIYVSKRFAQNDSFKTIMKWAWKEHTDQSQLDDESILLLGINITWFMASTCDRVRDVSIKAMVKLFTNRIDILADIIKKFKRVKDAYILEALFCAAYGCVMNTRDMDQVEDLASYIYEELFDGKEVIPHAMIRNYMTGILEFALSKGLCENIQAEDIKPPFKNRYEFNEVKQDEIDDLRVEPSDAEISRMDPHHSYRSRVLDLEMYFTCQTNIIDNLQACYTNVPIQHGDSIHFETVEIMDQILPEYRENFVRMVIQEIFQMGYNFIKFGEFDFNVDHNQMDSLGQKYEWIALNKILAVYLDSKQYICQRFSDDYPVKYEGVWQFTFFRKIDPSIDYYSPFDTRDYQYTGITMTREDLLSQFRSYAERSLDQIDWISVNRIEYTVNNELHSTRPFLINNSEIESFKRYIQDPNNLQQKPIEDLYVGEIYWSEAYKSLLNEKNQRNCSKLYDMRIMDTYLWDINDGAMNNCIEFSILSSLMLTELKLSMGSNVFELVDENGELASLQLYEHNYDNILLLRRDIVTRYLIRSDKVIGWPVIHGEETRMVIFDGLQFRID